jgi:hypothetical protein
MGAGRSSYEHTGFSTPRPRTTPVLGARDEFNEHAGMFDDPYDD